MLAIHFLGGCRIGTWSSQGVVHGMGLAHYRSWLPTLRRCSQLERTNIVAQDLLCGITVALPWGWVCALKSTTELQVSGIGGEELSTTLIDRVSNKSILIRKKCFFIEEVVSHKRIPPGWHHCPDKELQILDPSSFCCTKSSHSFPPGEWCPLVSYCSGSSCHSTLSVHRAHCSTWSMDCPVHYWTIVF